MKVIISHDIDHLTAWEHATRDMILPKYVARMHLELFTGKINFSQYLKRFGSFFSNKWNHVDELMEYNKKMNIPSQFFIGVKNGVGLSYSLKESGKMIHHIRQRGGIIGVHGIAFDNAVDIAEEHRRFKELYGENNFGMRMHYVRKTENTMQWIADAGYRFDSTEHAWKAPYKIGEMWEFPFQVMDSWVMEQGKRWQTSTLENAKKISLELLEKAQSENLPYLGIIFHDHYFSSAHQDWMDWYKWFTNHLASQKMEFISFHHAIKELEK